MKYEVVMTVFEPDYKVVRFPSVDTEEEAKDLAKFLKYSYPRALIEIAHDGLRQCA